MTSTTRPRLSYLDNASLDIHTIPGPVGDCSACRQAPAILRVTGQPAFDINYPIECEEGCVDCAPWLVSTALEQQTPSSARRPIVVEVAASVWAARDDDPEGC